MPFGALGALGAFGQGSQQGMAAATDLRQKMMQIQQMQMALDQAKKTTAAQALMAQSYNSNSQGSSAPTGAAQPPPPPMAPGGSPMPSGPQGASPWSQGASPPMPQQGPQPMGGMPQGGMQAPPGPMPAPQPPQGQGAGMPPQAAGSPQGAGALQQMSQLLNSGQLDPNTALQNIFTRLWKANPNADPETISMAAEQAVTMMHGLGLDPATKFQMQMLLNEQRGQTQESIATGHDDTRKDIAGEQQAGAMARTQVQQAGATGRTAMSQAGATERTGMSQAGANDRSNARIADMDKRFTEAQKGIQDRFSAKQGSSVQAQAMNQRLRALSGELSAARTRLNVASQANPPDQAGMDRANKDIDAIDGKLKILEGAVKTSPSAGKPQPQDKGASVDAIHPPSPGTVQNGWKFLGGDPARQSSWQKVQ